MAEEETVLSESGGTMQRLAGPAGEGAEDAQVDLGVLEQLRTGGLPGPIRPAGPAPYWPAGTVLTWHYGQSAEVLRVVRDDDRGLVAWLAPGSQVLVNSPTDGRAWRDRPPEERVVVERELRLSTWQGPGILRIAPTGRPWSLWYFWGEAGEFEGHYLNIELPHVRPVSGEPRVLTRDLVLDLWLGADGELWLKDADELAAAVSAGLFTADQGEAVRAVADLARRELVEPRGWPLDEGWEDWRPPPGWEQPLDLPAPRAE